MMTRKPIAGRDAKRATTDRPQSRQAKGTRETGQREFDKSAVVDDGTPGEAAFEAPAPTRSHPRSLSSRGAGSDKSPPQEWLGLAAALGEQSANVIDAMDRWFEHLFARLPALDERPTDPALAPSPRLVARAAPIGRSPQAAHARRIAQFNPADNWVGWRRLGQCRLSADGVIEIGQADGEAGVTTPPIRVEGGAVARATFHGVKGGGGWSVRLLDAEGRPISADAPIGDATTSVSYYIPQRVGEVRLCFVAPRPSPGIATIGALDVEAVDLDDYQAELANRQPVLASIASIPQREEFLVDSVRSLLASCDHVRVFLNGYARTPPFLDHPRVEIRRSQSWDDRGDAGKFAWIESDRDPGYRIVADDDLIYPVDFAKTLIEASKRYQDKAIVGLHGVLLKQPFAHYYDPASRSVIHFEERLDADRAVHVLGTNAVCFHSTLVRMRPADFLWPNMADIFLARYAQRNAIAMIAIARGARWARQNGGDSAQFDTIYDHSLRRTGSPFDTSSMQDIVVATMTPITLQPTNRPKIVILAPLASIEDFERLEAMIHPALPADFEWAIVAVSLSPEDALFDRMDSWAPEYETHILADQGGDAIEQMNAAIELVRGIRCAMLLVAVGDYPLVWRERLRDILAALGAGRALAARHATAARQGGKARARGARQEAMVLAFVPWTFLGAAASSGDGSSAPWPTHEWLSSLGALSPVAPPERAEWGALIAGPPEAGAAQASSLCVELFERTVKEGRRAPPGGSPKLAANEVFSRILVLNEDSRGDGWSQTRDRLRRAGVSAERISATRARGADGIHEQFRRYLKSPQPSAPDARRITSGAEFYFDYDSHAARVVYATEIFGRRAIRSASSWAYLRAWRNALETALRDGCASMLVLGDKIVLHKRFPELFAAAVGGLPADWMVLQLGSLQLSWGEPWLEPRGRFLYRSNGAAFGSYAIAVRSEAMPFLLNAVNRMDLPFDAGPLSETIRAFADRSYVVAPHLIIPYPDHPDPVPVVTPAAGVREPDELMRDWPLDDYDIDEAGPGEEGP